MIVRARTLVPMAGEPVENGAVLVKGSEVAAVGRFPEIRAAHMREEIVDLGEQALLPGLINAHCHLDYTLFRGAIAPPKSFTQWIAKINSLKRSFDDDDILRSIAAGFAELKRWGVTTVLNIEAFPELMHRLPPPPIRTWWFYEMIDIRHREPTENVVAGALMFMESHPSWLGGFGLSPHAPYTASLELYRRANDCARMLGLPVTTHVAESGEEDMMFRSGEGPLSEFLRSLGRPMDDCGGRTSFSTLARSGLIEPNWILVHLNQLDADDFALVERDPALRRLNVVHCPQSHSFFSHSPFQFRRLRDLGANIGVGTDSLASGDSLNMLAELRAVVRNEPWLRPREALELATTNPARALGREGRLGRISPGALADLIALPFSAKIESVYEAILEHRNPVGWTMIDGNVVD